jgi:hypothetical protein
LIIPVAKTWYSEDEVDLEKFSLNYPVLIKGLSASKLEKIFFEKNMELLKTEDIYYGNNLINKYENGEYLFNDGYDFSRHLSFKIRLNEIEKFRK